MPNTAAPSTRAATTPCLPIAPETAMYSAAQMTPEIVPRIDLCSPMTPPPAPTKQPRPTITGHNCRFTLSRCEMAAHTAATISKLKALVVEALICWASSSEGGLRRQHNGLAGRGATAVWLRSLNYIGFHRVILRQSQPIGPRRSLEIARLHALPELALVVAGEGRGVLLRLVAEDGEDLRVQLVLRQRNENVRFGERPFLPGAAIQPDLGLLPLIARERLLDRRLARAVGAVRVREIAGDEHEIGPRLFDQAQHDRDILVTQRPLPHLARPVKRQIEEPRGAGRNADRCQRRDRFRFAN